MGTPGKLTSFLLFFFFFFFSTRETTFVTSCLLSYTQIHFLKRGLYKREEFAPNGSKFLPFRRDLFLEGAKPILTEWSPFEVQ